MTQSHRRTPALRVTGHPSTSAPAAQRGRLLVATGLVGLLAVAGVAYLAQDQPGSDAPATGSSAALPPGDFPDPGLVHVHGLGVDPADGALYAATHSGLFRLPEDDGEPTRVANRYQDTMGFTVSGPGTFLGSGHPDWREDHPPRLGLIESTDAGLTWQPLSLRGRADFHALHAVHGNVYGYESGSGEFMVSTDRTDWETRSRLPMRDFAVSPTDPDTVLATTGRGLARSTDGGRTWRGVDAPVLTVLAWTSADSLYGIGPDGAVHSSRDGGTTWTERGSAGGAPEAVTVDATGPQETLYVAVSERGILQSTDGGRSFSTRYAE